MLQDEQLKDEFVEILKPELKQETLTDELLEKISSGSGRWFLPDDTNVAVCDSCKRYSFLNSITGEKCDKCGKTFTKIILAGNLPDDYDMNL